MLALFQAWEEADVATSYGLRPRHSVTVPKSVIATRSSVWLDRRPALDDLIGLDLEAGLIFLLLVDRFDGQSKSDLQIESALSKLCAGDGNRIGTDLGSSRGRLPSKPTCCKLGKLWSSSGNLRSRSACFKAISLGTSGICDWLSWRVTWTTMESTGSCSDKLFAFPSLRVLDMLQGEGMPRFWDGLFSFGRM